HSQLSSPAPPAYIVQHLPCSHACSLYRLFFFTAPPPPHIYTLSLHDALPISRQRFRRALVVAQVAIAFVLLVGAGLLARSLAALDRKSTRLNSSHQIISYAVFCLKKKKAKACDLAGSHHDVTHSVDRVHNETL